jgi:hypothetical protein
MNVSCSGGPDMPFCWTVECLFVFLQNVAGNSDICAVFPVGVGYLLFLLVIIHDIVLPSAADLSMGRVHTFVLLTSLSLTAQLRNGG